MPRKPRINSPLGRGAQPQFIKTGAGRGGFIPTILNDYMKNAIILFVLIFILYFFFVSLFYPELSDRGLFGDMFGGINAVFSGLAFLGLFMQ